MLHYDQILVLGSIIAVLLGILSAYKLTLFPASAVFVGIFFVKEGMYFITKMGSFTINKVFLVSFFFAFIFKYKLKIKDLLISKFNEVSSSKYLRPILFFYLLSITVCIIFHLIVWQKFPMIFFRSSLVPLWGCCIGLLIPTSDSHLNVMLKGLAVVFFIIFSIYAIPSFYYYHLTGQSISRSFVVSHDNPFWFQFVYFVPNFSVANFSVPFERWLTLDARSKNEIIIVLTPALAFIGYYILYAKKNIVLMLNIFLLFFIFYFLYVNLNFSTVAIFYICLLIIFALHLIYLFIGRHQKFLARSLVFLVVLFSSVFFTFYNDYQRYISVGEMYEKDSVEYKLHMNRFVAQSQYYGRFMTKGFDVHANGDSFSESRIAQILRTGTYFLENFPLRGCGSPVNSVDRDSGLISKALSGRSTIVDNFISWGLVVGLFANFIYFLPILLAIKFRSKNFSYFELSFWLLYFTSTILLSLVDNLGTQTNQAAIYLMLMTVFIRRADSMEYSKKQISTV